MGKSIENYQIHAYLDGQLSKEESLEIEHAMQFDEILREEVSQISALKAQLKSAYADIPIPERKSLKRQSTRDWVIPKSAVASLFLGLILGAGLLNVYVQGLGVQETTLQQTAQHKYLIHLDSNAPEKLELALAKTAALLSQGDPMMKVDLISNSEGVQAFDVNNPKRQQLEALLSRYDNLTLYACKRALERAKERGENLQLLPQVHYDQPAIDAVAQRLTTGWKYIKI